MLIVDFNKSFTDVAGEIIPDSNMGAVLANALYQGNMGLEDIKAVSLALDLFKTKKLSADKIDLQKILKGLQSAKLVPFVKVQLSEQINHVLTEAK